MTAPFYRFGKQGFVAKSAQFYCNTLVGCGDSTHRCRESGTKVCHYWFCKQIFITIYNLISAPLCKVNRLGEAETEGLQHRIDWFCSAFIFAPNSNQMTPPFPPHKQNNRQSQHIIRCDCFVFSLPPPICLPRTKIHAFTPSEFTLCFHHLFDMRLILNYNK